MTHVANNKGNVSTVMTRPKGAKLSNKDNFLKVAKTVVCCFTIKWGQEEITICKL